MGPIKNEWVKFPSFFLHEMRVVGACDWKHVNWGMHDWRPNPQSPRTTTHRFGLINIRLTSLIKLVTGKRRYNSAATSMDGTQYAIKFRPRREVWHQFNFDARASPVCVSHWCAPPPDHPDWHPWTALDAISPAHNSIWVRQALHASSATWKIELGAKARVCSPLAHTAWKIAFRVCAQYLGKFG